MEFVIASANEVNRLYEALNNVLLQNKVITVSELKSFLGLPSFRVDLDRGWNTLGGWKTTRVEDGIKLEIPEPVDILETQGAWFVYIQDMSAVPKALFADELEARRYSDDLGYGEVKFWPFGKAWEDVV